MFNHAFRKIFRLRVVRFPLYFLLGAIFLLALLNVPVFVYLGVAKVVDGYGYCPASHKFMTSEGRIDAAIEAIQRKRSVYIYEVDEHYPRIAYKSIADFKEQNPDCCSISPADKWEEFFNEQGGSASSSVRVRYTARYQLPDGKIGSHKFDEGAIFVDSCGSATNSFD